MGSMEINIPLPYMEHIPDAPCMDYLPTLGEKWQHSRGNIGKYSLHGASGYGINGGKYSIAILPYMEHMGMVCFYNPDPSRSSRIKDLINLTPRSKDSMGEIGRISGALGHTKGSFGKVP